MEMEASEVCSLADDYDIMKSERDDKRQEVGDLEEDVNEWKKTIAGLDGEVMFQKTVREEDKKNSGTKRKGLFGPCWRDAACQAIPVGVYKSVGVVAPVVDQTPRDVAVQAAVSLLVSTSSKQNDGQVVAVVTPKPSYTSVATQATVVPTGPSNGTSGAPMPLSGVVGP